MYPSYAGWWKPLYTFSLDVPFPPVCGAVSKRPWVEIEFLLLGLTFSGGGSPVRLPDFDLKLYQFAIVVWSLLVCRNKMTIEKKSSRHRQLIPCTNMIYFCRNGRFYCVTKTEGNWGRSGTAWQAGQETLRSRGVSAPLLKRSSD